MKGVRTALDVLGPEEATPEISVKLDDWQPADTAPRESRLQFLAWDGERAFVTHWNSGAWWVPGRTADFTHWRHLPAPPQDPRL